MILIHTQAILKVVSTDVTANSASSFLHHHSSKLVKSSWNLHNYPSLSPNSSKNGVCIIQVPWVHRILNSMHTKFLGRYAIFHVLWKASFQTKLIFNYRCDDNVIWKSQKDLKIKCLVPIHILLWLIRVNAWHLSFIILDQDLIYRWIPWILFKKYRSRSLTFVHQCTVFFHNLYSNLALQIRFVDEVDYRMVSYPFTDLIKY